MPAPSRHKDQSKADQAKPSTEYEDLGDGAVSGNLTRDPEVRFTPQGSCVATLRVAETPRTRNADTGQWEDGKTAFWDVVIWGDQGSRAADLLIKGDRIAAVGMWQEQRWTAPDGEAKAKTVLVARDIGPSLLFREVKIQRGSGKDGK